MGGKGSGKPGGPKSAKHKAALSRSMKKRYAKMTAKQRKAQLAEAHGVGWSAERRAAQSKRLKGTKLSEEHKAKVSAGLKRYFARLRRKGKR